MREERRDTARVQEDDRLVGPDISRSHIGDQRRHRFRGIGRIKKDPVAFGEQPDGFEARGSRNPVALADVLLVRRDTGERNNAPRSERCWKLRCSIDALSSQSFGTGIM